MIFAGADWHQDEYIWKSREKLRGDAYKALTSAQQVILEHPAKSKAVILAGDICNSRKVDGLTLKAITDFVDTLFTNGIHVYFIQGNHDKGIVGILEVQGARPLDGKVVQIDGRAVSGLNWRPREQLQEDIKTVPPCDILMLHCKMEHLCGYKMAADLSMEDIPARIKNVVVGDIHIAALTAMPNSDGFCLSPGALHPCNITEDGPHGIWALDDTADAQWEFLPTESRRIYRHAIPDTSDESALRVVFEELEKFLLGHTEDPLPLVEISYPTAHTEWVDRLLIKCKHRANFFAKPGATGKVMNQGDLREIRAAVDDLSLEKGLAEFVDPTKEKGVYDFLYDLLNTPEPLALVQTRLKEVIGEADKT